MGTLHHLRPLVTVQRSTDVDALPSAGLQELAVFELVRRYPYGGNQLEAALREAFAMGWRGRHDLQRLRESNANG